MKRIIKKYEKWMTVKSKINNSGPIRSMKEGEVWWAAVGENVGVEIDGKSRRYSRPVVILKKHSDLCFTAVPLTSKRHQGSWYMSFCFQGRMQTAVLVQTKMMDVTRLYGRMGEVSKGDYRKILDAYVALLRNKNMPQP